jgi:hypothetical protein
MIRHDGVLKEEQGEAMAKKRQYDFGIPQQKNRMLLVIGMDNNTCTTDIEGRREIPQRQKQRDGFVLEATNTQIKCSG